MNINTKQNLQFYIPTHHSGGRSLNFNSTSFFSTSEWYNYVLENGFNNKTTKIHLFLKQQNFKQNLKLKRLTFKNVELSNVKNIIRNSILSYSLFWYAIHLELLKKNCSFIHAAILEKENQGTVMCGTGGAGKTSLCLELLKDDNTNYLSEDFGIVDSNGYLHVVQGSHNERMKYRKSSNPNSVSSWGSTVNFGSSSDPNRHRRAPWHPAARAARGRFPGPGGRAEARGGGESHFPRGFRPQAWPGRHLTSPELPRGCPAILPTR